MAGGEDGDVVVAGGLLEGLGALAAGITVEQATEQLREVLSPAALSVRGGIYGQPLSELGNRLEPAPRWTQPAIAVDDALAEVLHQAWEAALADRHWPYPPVLRLTVSGTADADTLMSIARVGNILVVPCVARRARRFAWRWPLRVGIAAGPRARDWLDQLNATTYAGELFDARIVDGTDLDPAEIMLVDANGIAARSDRSHDERYQATCVVMIGAGATATELMARAATEFDPAIAVGVPVDGIDWFKPMFYDMTHDHPVDVAFANIEPSARVAAEPGLVNLTAVARWAYELAERSTPGHPGPDLRQIVDQTAFDQESEGGRSVVGGSRALEQAGIDTTVEFRLATAAEPGAPGGEPPPEVRAPRARRLIAEVRENGATRRKVLRPETDHQLEVRIAIPERGEISLDANFPDPAVPETDVVATLTVQVPQRGARPPRRSRDHDSDRRQVGVEHLGRLRVPDRHRRIGRRDRDPRPPQGTPVAGGDARGASAVAVGCVGSGTSLRQHALG